MVPPWMPSCRLRSPTGAGQEPAPDRAFRGRAGQHPARHRSRYRAGRGRGHRRPVRLRQDQPADGAGRAGARQSGQHRAGRAASSPRWTRMRWPGCAARLIGIVFQAFHLIPTMTALENVAVPLELAGVRDAMARARAGAGCGRAGHRLTHLPGQLSGGEQQRVALARAFAPRPRLLLADEPTGNLDQATGDAVMDLLFRLRAETGTTLLLITHDAHLAARCSRRIHLADGRVAEIDLSRCAPNRSSDAGLPPGAAGTARRRARPVDRAAVPRAGRRRDRRGRHAARGDRSRTGGGRQAHPGRRPGGGERFAASAGSRCATGCARGAPRCRMSCRCARCWSRRRASGSWWS